MGRSRPTYLVNWPQRAPPAPPGPPDELGIVLREEGLGRRRSDYDPGVTTESVRAALRHVLDPEVGINVVDLGLVYDVRVQDGNVSVAMTMTTPVCPLGETLRAQAEAAIRQTVPGVKSVTVDLVWDPPWRSSMMSDAAREQLGWAE